MSTKRKRVRHVKRERAMCLKLSDAEMDAFDAMADQKGTTKVALIRQWLRDAAQRDQSTMPSPEEFLGEFRRVFAGKIRRG